MSSTGRRRTPATGRVRPLVVALGFMLPAAAAVTVFLRAGIGSVEAVAAPGPADLADALLVVVAALGACLSAWLGCGALLTALAALPGPAGSRAGRWAERVAPATLRKLVTLTLGTTLAAGVGGSPATAAGSVQGHGQHPAAVPTASVTTASVTGAPMAPTASEMPARSPAPTASSAPEKGVLVTDAANAPDPSWRPLRPPPVADRRGEAIDLLSRGPGAGRLVDEDVVVRRGDSLWTIVGRHLGPTATSAEIAHEWPRWFAANRDVIGDNPDLIRPGQSLRPPTNGGMP